MLSYLFEVSFSWFIFYLAYALFLQQERFFGVNRAYLLVALIGGLCLPFLQIETANVYLPQLPFLLNEITVGVGQNVDFAEQGSHWSVSEILFTIYLIGISVGLFRFALSLNKLYQLYKEGIIEHKTAYNLIKTKSIHSPFSFGSYLFISNNIALEDREYQYIIEHEVTHIRQKHTIDLLLVEILAIVFWFNPLIFLYRTALRDQHEFLADKAVLSHVPIKEYGQLLIEQSIPGLKIGLVNHLIYSQLKKRINMMTKKKQSNKTPYLRYALSFSAFLLVFWTVSCQKEVKEVSDQTLSLVDQMPRFPGCEEELGDDADKKHCADQALLKFIYNNIEYPQEAKNAGKEGIAVARFIVTSEGKIKDASIIRPLSKECDAEVLRVVQLMNDKNILWTPGKQADETVNVILNLPVRFKLQ